LYWRDPVPILEDIPEISKPEPDMENKKEAEESEVGGDNNGENSKENSPSEDENLAAEDTAKDLADLPDLEGVVVSNSVPV
jgi:hypothetical protein